MVVVYAFNPSTLEAEVDGSLRVWGQSGLQSEFQDSQGYTEKLCWKTNEKDPIPLLTVSYGFLTEIAENYDLTCGVDLIPKGRSIKVTR